MNDIKKAINYIQNMDLSVFNDKQEACEVVDFITEILERSTEPTASEFLSKAQAICRSREVYCGRKHQNGICPCFRLCNQSFRGTDESDLIQAVMDYQIKEETNGRID